MKQLTPEACFRALQTRDARFDGRFFVGVISTGVYCRPVCPARTPKFEHCRFFSSAAAAQTAGLRPCLRCRPETAPEPASWRGTSNTVSRALALIAEGALDGNSDLTTLAARLGVGERQLRRLFQRHLGASPLAVAQTRRILFAKQLLHDTQMPMAQVAFAAGFSSVRRFNEIFRDLFRRPPSSLRRRGKHSDAQAPITLFIRYRPPYDWEAMLDYLAKRAIAGLEYVAGGTYRRTALVDNVSGTVEVAHVPARNSLKVTIRIPRVPSLRTLPAIGLAVRAVLGQQVSVQAARQLAGKLVAICGQKLPPESAEDRLMHLFPSATCLKEVDLRLLGMPARRRTTLHALADAAVSNPHLFEAQATIEEALAGLQNIPGIGPWTAEYIALRALREPDAFPASDVGLLRGAAGLAGARPTPAKLLERAEPWRPWRACAAQHLWAAGAAHD
jgi:AraC family transcriptional regulator, regulatory protein of adaptative response / DNA-3-methyladenine glycosylase II